MSAEHGDRQVTIAFAALTLGASAYTLLQSMVLPALPTIQEDLHTSQATVTWVLTAYLLSASVATPILGRLGDMFGKKKMLVAVYAALTAGSLLAGLSNSVGLLIVARVIQGMGGGMFPLSFGIIRDEFPARRVPGAIGLMSGMLGIGSALGMVIAGPVVDHLSWHWLFWIPLVISALATLTTALFIPESPVRSPGRVNLPAAALLSGWLVALLLGLNRGAAWGWTASGTLGLFVAAALLLVLWIQVENRSAVPLIDMTMMRIPAVWWTNVASLLLGVGMFSTFVVIPPFLQAPPEAGYGFDASVTVSGLYLLPSTITMILAGSLIGRIAARLGSKLPLVVGSLLAAVPFLMLSVAHHEPWEFFLATTIQGLGIGLAFSSMSNLIIEAVPSAQTGAATGMNANIRTIGGSIGSQIIASILASGALASGLPSEHGYSVSFAVLATSMITAGVAAAIVPVRRQLAGAPATGTVALPEPRGGATVTAESR
ncbi:MFS transporter [Protofrankia symbiont of Coriaria ruscifolia]|uniref:Major facilitator superfamily protein n=1 Tax=Candidatus Protofrankia californiensis TaxID=1839754 RepID=A0A1C3PGF7_9ACTN|nr:MFS transporter [Protofrankia symbiont of Coriaria ruscifolia]SBW28914.1 major facilitator superfamily protein [Candidatus Protofrankia californiensis]